MITSTSSVPAAAAAAEFTFTPSTSATSINSFAQQLASALEGFLSQGSNVSAMEIDITPQQSQNSGISQFVVTVQNSASPAAAASSAASSVPVAGSVIPVAVSAPSNASTPSVPATSSSAAASAATNSAANTVDDSSYVGSMCGMVASAASVAASAKLHGLTATAAASTAAAPLPSATDAYWAMQPKAVQALRYMPVNDRPSAAMALAGQGYTIDVPIMVNGWDPLMTMNLRKSDGYTWVPSAMQPNIQVAPGLTFPGLPSYDAANPPPGSILVSNAFADGTSGDSVVDYINAAQAKDPFSI